MTNLGVCYEFSCTLLCPSHGNTSPERTTRAQLWQQEPNHGRYTITVFYNCDARRRFAALSRFVDVYRDSPPMGFHHLYAVNSCLTQSCLARLMAGLTRPMAGLLDLGGEFQCLFQTVVTWLGRCDTHVMFYNSTRAD